MSRKLLGWSSTAAEAGCSRACELQLLNPEHLEPAHATRSRPHSLQVEKTRGKEQRLSAAIDK